MDMTTLIFVVIAGGLFAIACWRGRDLPVSGMIAAGRMLWRNLLVLLLGFLIAGLVQVLIPGEVISRWLGTQAGIKGVLIACVVGGLMPGSPYAVFPLVGALYRAGASTGAVVGFLSAWSLWSVTRLPLEAALIDPQVAITRYIVTFAVPPLAGLASNLLVEMM
ncbi:MAG: permease [Anaerolineae bacterium]|nr:permease [Anaerolineae bacterium]